MNPRNLWLYAHILLLVYWLGADLGVLLLARAAKRSALSFQERAFALKMSMLIDFTPRICFALMFPVGMQLANASGYASLGTGPLALAWCVAAAWIALLLWLARSEGTARAALLNRLHLGLQALLLLIIGYVGVLSWAGSGPFTAGWLAAKIILFAAIFALGIGIDFAFRPVVPAFIRLATEGSKPDIEYSICTAIDGAIRYVLALYALLLIIAFLGTTKPF